MQLGAALYRMIKTKHLVNGNITIFTIFTGCLSFDISFSNSGDLNHDAYLNYCLNKKVIKINCDVNYI